MAGQAKSTTRQFDPKADSLLRRAYEQSELGKQRSAFRLYLAAAKLGDSYGQQALGYCYDVGVGVKPNRSAAMRWYLLAFRKGNTSAANNIGTIYRDEGDLKRALKWFERAIALGEIDANLEIAKIYLREKDRTAEALPYLRKILKGKPGMTVTIDYFKKAQRLLKKHFAKKMRTPKISHEH